MAKQFYPVKIEKILQLFLGNRDLRQHKEIYIEKKPKKENKKNIFTGSTATEPASPDTTHVSFNFKIEICDTEPE